MKCFFCLQQSFADNQYNNKIKQMDNNEQLVERNKELNCLYEIDKLGFEKNNPNEYFKKLITCIQNGFQYVSFVKVEIEYNSETYRSAYFEKTKYSLQKNIEFDNSVKGSLTVYYAPLPQDCVCLSQDAILRQRKRRWESCIREIEPNLKNIEIENIFDLHFITDKDIELKTSYAVMINSLNNSAKLLLKNDGGES